MLYCSLKASTRPSPTRARNLRPGVVNAYLATSTVSSYCLQLTENTSRERAVSHLNGLACSRARRASEPGGIYELAPPYFLSIGPIKLRSFDCPGRTSRLTGITHSTLPTHRRTLCVTAALQGKAMSRHVVPTWRVRSPLHTSNVRPPASLQYLCVSGDHSDQKTSFRFMDDSKRNPHGRATRSQQSAWG